MSGPTTALAEMVAGLEIGDLPDAVTDVLGQCLLDFVGVTALGSDVESSPPLLRGVDTVGGGGSSTVVARRETYSLETAALLNGTFAHSLDFDDTNIDSVIHPGAAVVPAALAVAEHLGSPGTELLAALAAGYETACRIGRGLGETVYQRGFHPTAIAGTFGAAAAVARLFRLDSETIEHAFGLAGSMAGGTMQYLANGAWNKRLHPGLAARGGLLAGVLAQNGFRGAAQALEGEHGALSLFAIEPSDTRVTANLGQDWLLLRTGFKPYPSCRLTHAAVDAALEAREKLGGPPDNAVSIRLSATAYSIVGGTEMHKIHPSNVVEAQFSVVFQCAVALLDGRVDWNSYDRMADADVRALSDRITVSADPDLASAAARLRCDDLTIGVDEPAGERLSRATWPAVEAKFRANAAGVLGNDRTERLVTLVQALASLESVDELMEALRSEGSDDAPPPQ
ncbi:MmgE/PrpD family protein [Amycolatopsis sp. GM8]|uniref:MmgE/PrpD family protein n=1 Tax=Amycolatopsis sp. GM8 TaxID=2896530 RepID=UPI001F359E20|nr:MmgE/PrpD family protein [Amycolatopsis sp. GM8]